MFYGTRVVSAISQAEFLQMFLRCTPPVGWSSVVGVANSGGPDSTCLLFLVNRLLSDEKMAGKGLPNSVVSITVDHGLQVSSSSMADQCSKNALSYKVKHLTIPIPWSKPPFPPRPSNLQNSENIARDARFHILFHAMTRMSVKTMAFGHHIDDQVETSLMRLARGTTELGAGGMRACRRWGMGLGRSVEDKLGWAGYEGMHRWIVRPLLDVSKERILATCAENGLEYVTDATNFQPNVTIRNAIRQMLKEEASDSGTTPDGNTAASLPDDLKEQLNKMKQASTRLRSVHYDISGGIEQLRGAVKVLSSRVTDIDDQVDRHIRLRTVPSPVGTFLLSGHNLAAISDLTVRSAMIMRIMRYVSFQPWGSIRADGNRRVNSIQRIVGTIWAPDPHSANIRNFVAGSGVLWTPVIIRSNLVAKDMVRIPKEKISDINLDAGDRFGWLASRQPPPLKNIRAIGDGPDPLVFNLTDQLCQLSNRLKEERLNDLTVRRTLEILYDCRFLLRFNVAKMPPEISISLTMGRSQILVVSHTRWYLPHVVWQTPDGSIDLAVMNDAVQEPGGVPEMPKDKLSSWITMDWIRTLDAT